MRMMSAGTAARLLCLPLLYTSPVSCQEVPTRKISDQDPQRRGSPDSLLKEFQANLEGVKKASTENANGAPVHVDTRVQPAAADAVHHDHVAGDPKGC